MKKPFNVIVCYGVEGGAPGSHEASVCKVVPQDAGLGSFAAAPSVSATRKAITPPGFCRKAAWGDGGWKLGTRPEKGSVVELSPGEVLLCGPPPALYAVAKRMAPAKGVAALVAPASTTPISTAAADAPLGDFMPVGDLGRFAGTPAKYIDFVIGDDGRIQFKVKGIKGGGCKKHAKEIEKILGMKVASDTATSEMYESVEQTSQATVSLRR